MAIQQDILTLIPPVWTVGIAAVLLGAVLIVWARSHRGDGIGIHAVSMIAAVIATMFAISAFVRN